jgi:hypothetical protein
MRDVGLSGWEKKGWISTLRSQCLSVSAACQQRLSHDAGIPGPIPCRFKGLAERCQAEAILHAHTFWRRATFISYQYMWCNHRPPAVAADLSRGKKKKRQKEKKSGAWGHPRVSSCYWHGLPAEYPERHAGDNAPKIIGLCRMLQRGASSPRKQPVRNCSFTPSGQSDLRLTPTRLLRCPAHKLGLAAETRPHLLSRVSLANAGRFKSETSPEAVAFYFFLSTYTAGEGWLTTSGRHPAIAQLSVPL